MLDECKSGEPMQDLGDVGFHPRSLAGCQDNDVKVSHLVGRIADIDHLRGRGPDPWPGSIRGTSNLTDTVHRRRVAARIDRSRPGAQRIDSES